MGLIFERYNLVTFNYSSLVIILCWFGLQSHFHLHLGIFNIAKSLHLHVATGQVSGKNAQLVWQGHKPFSTKRKEGGIYI